MKRPNKALSFLLIFLVSLFITELFAQKTFPISTETGKVYYSGKRDVGPRCKKKITKKVILWTSKKQPFPPAVMTISKSVKDTLWVKVVTEVPSIKHLHPISFDTRIVIEKQAFQFTATNFFFEDITLSLEAWLDKFKTSENPRHIKNVELITKGLDSHVFLTIENLKNIINNQKAE